MRNSLKKAFFGILALSLVLTMGNAVTTFANLGKTSETAVLSDAADSEVTTITTNPVTLKVGVSSEAMTSTYIEKLVSEADKSLAGGFSSGIRDKADGTPLWGSYDSEYFEMKEFIGIIDETTMVQFAEGYYTPAEAKALFAGRDVEGITFAEEGTGEAFVHLCPKKTGSTVVTTEPYKVNGKEYKVQIPINIVESSEDERDKAPTCAEAYAMKYGRPHAIEITTDPVTLKVGVLNDINIAKLAVQKYEKLAGCNAAKILDDFNGNAISGYYDHEFFQMKGLVMVVDETAEKVMTSGYYTPDEEKALLAAIEAHKDAGINYIAEGNGDSFSALIPTKTGNTELKTTLYTNKSEVYTVKIPVNIVDSSEDERLKKAPTWDDIYMMKFGTIIDIGTSTGDVISVPFSDVDKVLPEGAKLTSKKLESGTSYDAAVAAVKAAKTSSQTAVYEFDLKDSSNVSIHELDGKIAVTVTAPFEVEADNELHVYRLNDTDNSLVSCEVTVNEDGTVTFYTDHFSTYIFTSEPQEAGINAPQAGIIAPESGDKANIWLYAVMSLLCLGLMEVIIKGKRA